MIVNAEFIDSLTNATNNTLTFLGEIATKNRRAATDPRERDEFQKAELAIRLELLGRVKAARREWIRSELRATAGASA
jgi:hypothetical protein